MYIYATETLLYLSFSLFIGGLILRIVPERLQPELRIPPHLLLCCIIGIGLLSFFPLMRTALAFSETSSLPFFSVLASVIRNFETGRAWIWTLILCAALLCLLLFADLRTSWPARALAGALTAGLYLAYGWASHAAGLSAIWGMLAQTLHFAAVTTWLGLLFYLGWFSRPAGADTDRSAERAAKKATQRAADKLPGRFAERWLAFLGWFTPLSVGCVGAAAASGLYLMKLVSPSGYVSSWSSSYGQALLIKHLLLLPVLMFALVNGFLMKRSMIRAAAALETGGGVPDPRLFVQIESIFALLVLSATSFLGMQNPPHLPEETGGNLSPLFRAVYSGKWSEQLTSAVPLHLHLTVPSLLLALLTLSAAVLTLLRIRQIPAFMLVSLGLFIGWTAYLSCMLALE